MDKKRFKKFKRKLKNLNICNLNFSIFKLKMMIIVQFLLKAFKKMWNKNLLQRKFSRIWYSISGIPAR